MSDSLDSSPQLYIERDLPLIWHRFDALSGPACNTADNLAILQYLEARHEVGIPGALESRSENPDLARLEHKLDLVLRLLGLLLEQQQTPVPARRLRLCADEVSWKGTLPLRPGELLWLELYLEPQSRPLCLQGELLAVAPDLTRIRLVLEDSLFRETFEKWIFRQHRRAIAQSRSDKMPHKS